MTTSEEAMLTGYPPTIVSPRGEVGMPLSGYKSTKVIVTLGASLGGDFREGEGVPLILPRVGEKRYSLS